MAIKFLLMVVRFGDLELLPILSVTIGTFQAFQSIKSKQY